MATILGLLAVLSTAGFVQGEKPLSFAWYPEYPSYYIGEHDLSCVITVQAPKKVAVVRAPVSVTAVLDASGSMQGLPIAALKNTAEYMVEALGPLDYLGVVTYNDFVYETVPLISVDFSVKPSIKASLRAIIAGGGTNLSTGLFAGIDQQKRAHIPYSKYVLLFTDGVPNGGIEDIGEIEFLMSKELEAKNSPVVYTLGFGYEQDPNFLYRIARTGRGSYVYVNSAADIATSFGQVLGGLLSVYAHDIVCTLTPLAGSSIKRVQAGGYITPGRESWQIFFADLYAAERRDILIDMKIPILITPQSKQQVLRVDVTYFDPFTGAPYSAKPIIVIVERTIIKRPVYIVPNPVVDTTRVRYRCAEDIEKAVTFSSEGKYREAKALLDGTLAFIAGSSVWNVEEVQQYREDCIVVQKVVEKPEVIPPPVAAGYLAAAHSIGNQRAAGVTNDLHGPAIWVTEPKQEEAKKAQEFAAPVLPAEARSTAVGFANANVDDDGTVSAEVTNEASTDGEDSSASSTAISTASGDGADAESVAFATADSGGTEEGSADATAVADSTATGEDATATSTGDATAIAGQDDGSATAVTTSLAFASAPEEGDATATATGTSIAIAPAGDATATTTSFASSTAADGTATAAANSGAFAQGDDATAAAPAVAFAKGEEATASSVGDATAFASDDGDASAIGSAFSTAQGVDSATATAAAPAFAFSGDDGESVAVGSADAVAVASEGPALASGTADATAVAEDDGTADATATGFGFASGTDATATGTGNADATAGDDVAAASGSGTVDVTEDSAESVAAATAEGDSASAAASASAVSGPGGPRGRATGAGSAATGDATASATGTAEAFAPAPAPEQEPGSDK